MTRHDPPSQPEYDPTYLHSLRELVVILILFAMFCGWSILICGLLGYEIPDGSGEQISLVLGMPAWVFWGIFLPWIAVDVVAVRFCFFFMKVDDLEDSESADSAIQTGTEQGESDNA